MLFDLGCLRSRQLHAAMIGRTMSAARYKGRRDEVFVDWSACIRELAACANARAPFSTKPSY